LCEVELRVMGWDGMGWKTSVESIVGVSGNGIVKWNVLIRYEDDWDISQHWCPGLVKVHEQCMVGHGSAYHAQV
jgi:hypothetical protein